MSLSEMHVSSPASFARRLRLLLLAAVALVGLLPLLAVAQQRGLEIDIVGGNPSAMPIAIAPMPYQGVGTAPTTDVAEVVRANLARSGQFRPMPVADFAGQRPTRGSEIDYGFFQQAKQNYIVVGRVLDTGDGGYRVEYELFDIARNRLLAYSKTARVNAMRDLAHQIADEIYEKITGVRGAFWTRIAYVVQTGVGRNARYALMVADADGYNPHTVLPSDQPIMSPAWHPDGRRLAFVSFAGGKPGIYIVDVTRDSTLPPPIASFRGINSAPSFSPDGSKLAMTLSRSGNPEIYVMDVASRALTQLTNHFGIDTEPVWSADGTTIYFTSDRGGRPQIYQVPATGGSATRVSFQGSYNARATVSADGKRMAMAQGSGNVYRIAMLDRSLGSPRWSMLSPGSLDESPSFAPNASMVLYAAREGGRGVLYAVSADARVRQRLVVAGGDVREPAWGPYRSPR
jgi:TolB protein